MYHRGMKWEKYLELRGFKDDITNGLEQQTQAVVSKQEETAEQFVSAQLNAVGTKTEVLKHGFGSLVANQEEMIDAIAFVFADIAYGLDRVSQGIENLRSDFNWAMSAVLWKLEMQQETLKNILSTLQAPLDTQAKELRKRAEYAYQQGWYDEALNDFLASEQKNYQDFAIHQSIGNIYLYHRNPSDLEKAREYYLKAGKYATPNSSYYAALGFMHAGLVCYLQKDDDAAIKYAQKAININPQLIEAYYNHAKFAATANLPKIALPSLETAIRDDWKYAVKARADQDFKNIESGIIDMMERLLHEVETEAHQMLAYVQNEVPKYVTPKKFRKNYETILSEAKHLTTGIETYHDALIVREKIERCKRLWNIVTNGTEIKIPNADRVRYIVFSPREPIISYTAGLSKLQEMKRLRREGDNFETAKEKAEKNLDVCATIHLWNVMKGEDQFVLKGHTGKVDKLAFSPNGKILASISLNDSIVRLWDMKTGKKQKFFKANARSFAFSPDGEALVIGGIEEFLIVDISTGEKRLNIPVKSPSILDISFSPDGTLIAVAEGDPARGESTLRLWDVENKSWKFRLDGHRDTINSIEFSPNGSVLASASDDGTVRLWDTSTGEEKLSLIHSSEVLDVAISPNGLRLASGLMGREIWLWDLITENKSSVLHPGFLITSVSFSPDGAILASSGYGNRIRLWGQAKKKTEWHDIQQKREKALQERNKREELERKKEELDKKRQQQKAWREAGCCEICGKKLNFLEKTFGHSRCKKHRWKTLYKRIPNSCREKPNHA